MSIDSISKKIKKAGELLEEINKPEEHKWQKIAEDKEDEEIFTLIIEGVTTLKFSKTQFEVFSRLVLTNAENSPNRDITEEEQFEIFYNSLIQTLKLIQNNRLRQKLKELRNER